MSIRRPMCLVSFVFMCLLYALISFLGGVDEKEYISDYKKVIVSGLIKEKAVKNDKEIIYIEKCEIVSDKQEIHNQSHPNKSYILYLDNQVNKDFKIGQWIEAEGTYANFAIPENDGQFNLRRYYRIRGYEASINKAKINKCGTNYDRYREWLYKRKEYTGGIYDYCITDADAGTLSAMVLGDKTNLEADVKELYQAAGISHILSLSGLHIATVGMCVYAILYGIGAGLYMSSIISTVIMVSYGIMTGLSTSTLRALVMFLLAILAKNIGRTYDLLSAASLSSLLILLENPYYVFDTGFQMSFLSVIGIGMIYPILISISEIKISGRYQLIKHIIDSKVFEKIKQSICISISASMATLPVVMNSFYKVSRYNIFINIIVVPLMSLVLGLGIISGIIGNVLFRVPFFRKIVFCLLIFTDKILEFYSLVCEKIVLIPGNTWVLGKAETWQIVVFICALFYAYMLFEYNRHMKSGRNLQNKARKNYLRVRLILLIFSAIIIISYRKVPSCSMNFLSVGQGSCNVIYGKNVPTVIFDGGSSDVKNVGSNRIIPFLLSKGIDTVDYLFISHPDEDHVNGIKEMLRSNTSGIRIRYLFMSNEDEEIFSIAKDKGIVTYVIKFGDVIKGEKLTMECMYPFDVDKISYTTNDQSLVMKMSYIPTQDKLSKLTALFTGDISSEVEKELSISEADILAVPHHGSKYSSSEAFLKTVDPNYCIISAGAHNSYGHPHKETLERLDKFAPKAKVLRTDKCGQITIAVDQGKIVLKKFNDNSN